MKLAALLASALLAASPAGAEIFQVEMTGTLVSQVEPGVDPFFSVGDQITLRARFDSDRTAPWENGLTLAAFGETGFPGDPPLFIEGPEYFRIEGNGLVWSAFDDHFEGISVYTEMIEVIHPDLSGSDQTRRVFYGPALVYDSEGHVRGLSGGFIRSFTDALPTLSAGSNLQGHYEAEIFPDGHSNIFSEYTTGLDSHFEIQPGRVTRFNTTDSRGFIGVWDFDNSRVTAVPEPATWAMLIVGFLIVGSAARRWRTGCPSYSPPKAGRFSAFTHTVAHASGDCSGANACKKAARAAWSAELVLLRLRVRVASTLLSAALKTRYPKRRV